MRKYYKFPRRYYNRNKVRKPLKPKHVIQLLLLSVAFYLLCSALFIGIYSTFYTSLERGDVVLSQPPFYHTAPFWLRAVDSVFQICTFHSVSLAELFGYDTGYTVKRIVGLPGDTVRIVGGHAYILLPGSEIYMEETDLGLVKEITPADVAMLKDVPDIKVEEGHYYLLSDNRAFLSDSRTMGTVEKKRIHAKVLYRLKSFRK